MRILLPLMMPGMMLTLSSKIQELHNPLMCGEKPRVEFASELRPRLCVDFM
jgi:hypothetical protein